MGQTTYEEELAAKKELVKSHIWKILQKYS